MFLITDMFFFPRGHRTPTCPLGWELNTLILVSFTFEKSSIVQCRKPTPVAITYKNIRLSFPELENSVFLDLVLLSCTTVATNSFVLLHGQATQLHYPVEFNRVKKPTLEGSTWTGGMNLSSLSLFSFSELNKALDTNENNWRRVFIFLPQELQTQFDLFSARNILFARTKSNEPPRLLWGLKHVLGTNLIPLRTKLVTQTKRVPAWPVINQLCFPERHFSANGISLHLSEGQMKFYERSLQALLSSAPRGSLTRSRETRFARPNRRACLQAMRCLEWWLLASFLWMYMYTW